MQPLSAIRQAGASHTNSVAAHEVYGLLIYVNNLIKDRSMV